MKVLLATLNSKYIHSSLALACLESACSSPERELALMEFTINESLAQVMAAIYRQSPDVLCFSCYIWNITQTLSLCRDFKKVSPDCLIVLGGPEVSYDAGQVLRDNPELDFIVRGEGEVTLKELLEHIEAGKMVSGVAGISYRDYRGVHDNPIRPPAELATLPSPHKKDYSHYRNLIIYYESSRGCPFNCSYCLSSNIKGVSYYPMERVKEELKHLLSFQAREIKLVDRTFNADEKRARAIMEFIIEQKPETMVHFEICADLLSEDFLDFLETVPAGIFNFEIGIQSTCPETLRAVRRSSNWERLRDNIIRLKANGNIHLHLDLIAGLPLESYERFQQSFNDVFNLRPHMLQLGFLKILKGSDIFGDKDKYNYRYQSLPPYQVLAHEHISYDQMIRLNQIEELLGRYYNSGIVPHTIKFAVDHVYKGDSFSFFEGLAADWEERKLFGLGHRREREYDYLLSFLKDKHHPFTPVWNELLKLDFLSNNRPHRFPGMIDRIQPEKAREILKYCLKKAEFTARLPNSVTGSVREMMKHMHLELFGFDPFAFDGEHRECALLFIYHPLDNKLIRLEAVQPASSSQIYME